ncbi:MAG: hypothetical protein HY268_03195 [Deltaproteobacteria bacterium]|nr:hypothetical protein [Deltaproteobacteria bacterium]
MIFEEKATVPEISQQSKKPKWPPALAEQAQAIRSTLVALSSPANPEDVARCFTHARVDRVTELLEVLISLGQSRRLEDGRFVAP